MIAKLVAWGEDRPVGDRADVARAARVPGARHPHDDSVLPVADAPPEYREGRYDTTYLDRLLEERRGESFTELDAATEELMAIAAGLDAYFRASESGVRRARRTGRREPMAARRPDGRVRE